MSFTFKQLAISDVILVTPSIYLDERGFFLESYKASEFARNGIERTFVQINHSHSTKHILRGLHYQLAPHAQGKFVRAVVGTIFDVAVDIRQGSPTFGKWVGETLSVENRNMLYIPEGFAHGFCVLSDVAETIYYCTSEYSPQHERGILWNDPTIGINWPVKAPVISEKDRALPVLAEAEKNFKYKAA